MKEMVDEAVIRRARRGDLPGIVSLAVQIVRQHESYDRSRFDVAWHTRDASIEERCRSFLGEQLTRQGAVILVAEHSGDIVGYAFARLEQGVFLDLSSDGGWLHDICVSEGHRRNGLGRRLLDGAITALHELGARKVLLGASPYNEGARRMFERRGFRPTMIEYMLDEPR